MHCPWKHCVSSPASFGDESSVWSLAAGPDPFLSMLASSPGLRDTRLWLSTTVSDGKGAPAWLPLSSGSSQPLCSPYSSVPKASVCRAQPGYRLSEPRLLCSQTSGSGCGAKQCASCRPALLVWSREDADPPHSSGHLSISPGFPVCVGSQQASGSKDPRAVPHPQT
ncbi:unnamed protein product [Pipistrellus nathusii]|uniref:Uncharacterized protein n=1 Tax=Pipistrellus nathusii TaxID=59473 RepID=A0ABN9ZD23_PIPNA